MKFKGWCKTKVGRMVFSVSHWCLVWPTKARSISHCPAYAPGTLLLAFASVQHLQSMRQARFMETRRKDATSLFWGGQTPFYGLGRRR